MRFLIEKDGVTAVEVRNGRRFRAHGIDKADAIRKLEEKMNGLVAAQSASPSSGTCLKCGRPRFADSPYDCCCC